MSDSEAKIAWLKTQQSLDTAIISAKQQFFCLSITNTLTR